MSQLQVTGEAKIRDIQGPVVANSGVISALDGAASQYVRGDGTLADFPTSSGGGSSVSYYLNSSVSQGTIGGVAYRELSKDPIVGAGTDIAISANGYVANYITDANDPDVTIVPGGNFNCEFYFSVNNNTGNPTTYAELYKYDGTTFTLLGTSAGVPESINQGTTIAPYYFAIPVATASLAITDRLAIRIYVNVDGRTVTLHTENSHLCQVVTTLSKGMVSLNNLTDQSQYLTTGTSGTNFAIVSSGDTHTFNLPVASATNTGKLSSTDWSTFNNKVPYTGATTDVDLGFNNFDANQINGFKILAKLDGTSSGSLILRTGTSGYSYGNDSISLISSPTSANTLTIISDISSVTKIAQIGLGSLTATRTYTLPDASGTLALTSNLSAYVPYTGATGDVDLGTFNLSTLGTLQSKYVYIIGNGTNSGFLSFSQYATPDLSGTHTNSIYTTSNNKVNFRFWQSGLSWKNFNFDVTSLTAGSDRTYTMPDASGTIALTSNLSSYVPYTGATTNVNLGSYALTTAAEITSKFVFVNGDGTYGGVLAFKQYASSFGSTTGHTTIYAQGYDKVFFSFHQAGGGGKVFNFDTSLLGTTNARTYTMPDASGTLALTSNLSAYLPLTGGTLTGALSGTSATFSGAVQTSRIKLIEPTYSTNYTIYTGVDNTNSIGIYNETSGVYNLKIASTGAATFSSSVTATQLFASTSSNVVGGINSSDANGGYLTWSTNSTIIADIGAANQIFGSGGAEMFGINARGSRNLAFGTNNTERMRITSGGSVGIGTSSPASYTGWTALTLNNITNGGLIDFQNNGTRYASIYNDSETFNIGSISNIPFRFLTGATERMRITTTGNVGIGTSSPSARINVYGNGVGAAIDWTNDISATGRTFRWVSLNSGGFAIEDITAGSERMRITSGGYLKASNNGSYYGATGAYHELLTDTGGQATVVIQNSSSNPYGIFVNFNTDVNNSTNYIFRGYSTGGGLSLYTIFSNGTTAGRSDIRLKKNIVDATSKLDNLMKLRVVNYEWITSINGIKEIGLIAQEVEEIFPSLVITEPIIKTREVEQQDGTILEEKYEDGDSKSIKHSVLPILTLKGLQELKSEKDAEIAELKAQIEELKALIAAK